MPHQNTLTHWYCKHYHSRNRNVSDHLQQCCMLTSSHDCMKKKNFHKLNIEDDKSLSSFVADQLHSCAASQPSKSSKWNSNCCYTDLTITVCLVLGTCFLFSHKCNKGITILCDCCSNWLCAINKSNKQETSYTHNNNFICIYFVSMCLIFFL